MLKVQQIVITDTTEQEIKVIEPVKGYPVLIGGEKAMQNYYEWEANHEETTGVDLVLSTSTTVIDGRNTEDKITNSIAFTKWINH